MKDAEIKTVINGYDFIWPETNLTVEVRHLNVHSDSHVTGELAIRNSNIDDPVTLLPPCQFNFSSDRTRSQLAKSLTDKYKDSENNWPDITDYLAIRVQELARAGEPAEEILVGEDEDYKPPELLLSPVIYEGVSNVVFGAKGSLKSSLCYLCGSIAALQWADNPLGFKPCSKPILPLVLDWEIDSGLFRWYLSRLQRGTNIPPVPFIYRHFVMPLAEELETVEHIIKENRIGLLIIDSLAAAAGGEASELKGSQSALQFNAALRKLKTTSLIIAQTSKGEEGKKSIYGSTLFTYYARNIFELCRSEDAGSDVVHLGLFHRECNLGKKSMPIGIRATYTDTGIKVEREPFSATEFMEKVSIGQRVYEALKASPKSVKELQEELEIKERTGIAVAINRLKEKGQVIKVGERWGLVAQGEA